MASVNENSEASTETPEPDAQSKGGVTFGCDVDMQETEALGAERTTPRASKPRTIQTPI